MYKEKIFDVITNEEIWRDYSEQEIIQVEKAQKEANARIAEQEAKDSARQNVLEKLGLTPEEAKILLG